MMPSRIWSSSGRLVRAWCTRVRWAGRPSAWVRHMPASRARTLSCRGRTPMGSMASIRGATPEASMIPSNTATGIMAGGPPRAAAPRRPRRPLQAGDQVAEPLGAADPGRVHERGQPQQVRGLGQPGRPQPAGVQPGQPAPAVQRGDQRVGDVPAARIGPAADQRVPSGRRGGQQPGVVAGQHRHRARPCAAHGHHHTAGAARDVGAAHITQVAADQWGAPSLPDCGPPVGSIRKGWV